MIQFYSPDIETTLELPESESSHCCRVLRMKIGDEIFVTDGKGHRFKCVIEKADPKKTFLSILEKHEEPIIRNYKITLAVAPTKNPDRLEWMVEKVVELGIDEIVLLKCDRSERKFQKGERLRKVIVSAMKQSLDTRMPELYEMLDFEKFIKNVSESSQKFFGYCSEHFPRKNFSKEIIPGKDIIIMIGPEGDFSEREVEMAVSNNFMPVTFGEKRLRTETAGVYAVCATESINQRLK